VVNPVITGAATVASTVMSIKAGQQLHIGSGDIDLFATIDNQGQQHIDQGGIAIGTQIDTLGGQFIHDGGTGSR
jgi:autotransporter passenger strand-loop-strand repeat protein